MHRERIHNIMNLETNKHLKTNENKKFQKKRNIDSMRNTTLFGIGKRANTRKHVLLSSR